MYKSIYEIPSFNFFMIILENKNEYLYKNIPNIRDKEKEQKIINDISFDYDKLIHEDILIFSKNKKIEYLKCKMSIIYHILNLIIDYNTKDLNNILIQFGIKLSEKLSDNISILEREIKSLKIDIENIDNKIKSNINFNEKLNIDWFFSIITDLSIYYKMDIDENIKLIKFCNLYNRAIEEIEKNKLKNLKNKNNGKAIY